ncbi:hypothetical protein K1T35_47465 (plasmid) [Pseudonocardia sp. DSM 110487]|uniref:hypothetical protein n=1 Tax=Pseudonocardia sp. DSM 110487 TaxID=2865833 RepID=UPI001C696ABC|nr:hypothetical protein [Pseudonocardia sp. DSM 110487]QYN40989.1 hypothetical protein K1T35_47465 [Pseudonocardia sp. DSM 110487]
MSSDLQLFILRCPDGQAWALSKVLVNWELSYEWDGDLAEPGEVVTGDGPYTHRECAHLDAAYSLADEIIEAAPGAWFMVWTDPGSTSDCQMAPGSLARYTPQLGKHEAYCDGEGQPLFHDRGIRDAARKGTAELDKELGWAWSNAMEGAAEQRVIKVSDPED